MLEINPSHPLIKELLERVKESDKTDQETTDMARMLVETAMINSGYQINTPADFSKRFYKLFNGAMGVPKDAPIEEVDLSADDDEEESTDAKSDDSTESSDSNEDSSSEEPSSNDETEETKSRDDP